MSKWTPLPEEDEEEPLVVVGGGGGGENRAAVGREKTPGNADGAVLKYTIWNELTARVCESVDEYWYYCKYIKDSCTINRNKNTGPTAAATPKKNRSFPIRAAFLGTFYKRNTASTAGEIEDELEGYNVPLLKIK